MTTTTRKPANPITRSLSTAPNPPPSPAPPAIRPAPARSATPRSAPAPRSAQQPRTPTYQPRVLSDDGSRLFFSSSDPIASPAAGGGLSEYEGGKVSLISPDGALLDASASGKDVFFASGQQLSQADGDELVDVYDARAEGGFSAPVKPVICEGREACGGAGTEPGPVHTPGTERFEAHEPPPGCKKGFARKHGNCVKQHKPGRHHKKRSHKRQAKRAGSDRRGNR